MMYEQPPLLFTSPKHKFNCLCFVMEIFKMHIYDNSTGVVIIIWFLELRGDHFQTRSQSSSPTTVVW